jgi:predicted methyltransferase
MAFWCKQPVTVRALAGSGCFEMRVPGCAPGQPRQNPSTLEDSNAGDARREPYQKPTELVAALRLSPGDWADVRAGAGYYSMELADAVGVERRVFAEDISDSSMKWLRRRVELFHLGNVEVVEGETGDPKLPVDRLAGILIVDSDHYFTDYPVMLEKFLHALAPGGRLAIADYSFTGHRGEIRAEEIKLHEIDPNLVRGEAERAGFQAIRCDDPFVKWRPGVGNTRASATDLWLLVAVRPK